MESAGWQHADSLKRIAGTEHDHSSTCHLTVTPSYQQRCTVSATLTPNNLLPHEATSVSLRD
jgi:hypothetical protein